MRKEDVNLTLSSISIATVQFKMSTYYCVFRIVVVGHVSVDCHPTRCIPLKMWYGGGMVSKILFRARAWKLSHDEKLSRKKNGTNGTKTSPFLTPEVNVTMRVVLRPFRN